jgi:hypothetical protein
VFELVLDVEKPYAGGRGKQDNRQMYEQQVNEAKAEAKTHQQACNCQVRAHDADKQSGMAPNQVEGKAVLDDKDVNRTDAQYDERIAVSETLRRLTSPMPRCCRFPQVA